MSESSRIYLENSDERMSKIEQSFTAKSFPDSVLVETTAHCNLNCIQCANSSLLRPKGFMEMSLFKKIVDEVAEENPEASFWFAFYGEPLIVKYKLFYMIRYAKEHGLKNTYVNTNAMLLNKDMAEMLIDSGLDHLIVGLDGCSSNTHDNIRRGAKYEVVKDNIIRLNNIRKKRGIGPRIEAQFIVMEENEHELEQYKKLWAEQQVAVKIRRRNTWAGRVGDDSYISNHLSRVACGWTIGICPITWDGKVVACGTDCDAAYPFGNVKEQSIKEIWNADKQGFIRKHLEHRFDELPELCRNCKDWQVLGHVDYDEDGNEITK